jgi:quercetin dioxygenase-like cupin family protein
MTVKTKIVEPNHGKHIAISGDINSILISMDDTNGTYSAIEAKVFPDGGPIPHVQTKEHEGFYVIDGIITFNVDGNEIIAKPGTFVNVPPYVTHGFKNNTNSVAKMLIILAVHLDYPTKSVRDSNEFSFNSDGSKPSIID